MVAVEEQRVRLTRAVTLRGRSPENWDDPFKRELGQASGLFLAEMVAKTNLSMYLQAFSLSRFDADETEQYLASTISQ
ncbi:MAG: hypothetical protein EXS42_02530 [Lacunisphaera sp.]|nr:hypothetical protein [Lacunisphaera sp.]